MNHAEMGRVPHKGWLRTVCCRQCPAVSLLWLTEAFYGGECREERGWWGRGKAGRGQGGKEWWWNCNCVDFNGIHTAR